MSLVRGKCSVHGCPFPHKAQGYCASHYHAVRQRGVDPATLGPLKTRDRTQYPSCQEPACDQPVKSKGMCAMHYARFLRHGHTMYRDRKKDPKICSSDGCDSWVYALGVCHLHWFRRRKYAEKYGVTPEQVDVMSVGQNHVCAICFKPETKLDSSSQKLQPLAVDHCHTSGSVRGLLCSRCNRCLGLLGDDPQVLASAILYLARHSDDPRSVISSAILRLSAL